MRKPCSDCGTLFRTPPIGDERDDDPQRCPSCERAWTEAQMRRIRREQDAGTLPPDRTHPFLSGRIEPPPPPPEPAEMISVLRWICPTCRESNPFEESMGGEVCACLSCGALAIPATDAVSDTPLLPVESARARKLLEW